MNRHIVDQYAEIVSTIKILEIKKDLLNYEIRKMMGSDDSLGGDEFIAMQSISERKGGIDEKALIEIGIDVSAFRKPSISLVTLRIQPRVSEFGL